MKNQDDTILLIGIGNSARQDDGLGWAFVEQVEQQQFFRGTCIYKFQLNIEDAELISRYETIIFVDAFNGILPNGYQIVACSPLPENYFSTHLLCPETVLYLSKELYHHMPKVWTVGIQGYQWELKEGITKGGERNLSKALEAFNKIFQNMY